MFTEQKESDEQIRKRKERQLMLERQRKERDAMVDNYQHLDDEIHESLGDLRKPKNRSTNDKRDRVDSDE